MNRSSIILEKNKISTRASVIPDSMPHRRRRTRKTKKRKTSKRRAGPTGGHRLVKGRISLRVAGFKGVQRLGASQLCRFVPLNKLKAAAKKILRGTGKKRGKKL